MANRSENRGIDPKDWIQKPNFGLTSKPKTGKKLKNPETGKQLTAKEKVRFNIGKEDFGFNDEQSVLYACGIKTAKELLI